MKKISLILLTTLMAVCLFNSCSSDDDDGTLVGKWKATKASITIKSNNSAFDKAFKDEMKDINAGGMIMEFTSDGKYYEDGDYMGTYTTKNGRIYVTDEDDDEYYIDYSQKGKNAEVYMDAMDFIEEEIEEGGIDMGDIVIKEATMTIYFTKI